MDIAPGAMSGVGHDEMEVRCWAPWARLAGPLNGGSGGVIGKI